MAKFFWVGSRPSGTNPLKSFSWQDVNNWRCPADANPTAEKAIKVSPVAPTRIPGAVAVGNTQIIDEVYIGYDIYYTTEAEGVTAASPLLFGGVTGNVSIASVTGGVTYGGGGTCGVYMYIGTPISEKLTPTNNTFRTNYAWPVLGGGVTGGGGYFSTIDDVKNWIISTYDIKTQPNGDTARQYVDKWFLPAAVAGNAVGGLANTQSLRLKALGVWERFNIDTTGTYTPLTVSLKLARLVPKGVTGPISVQYIRQGNACKTFIADSTIMSLNNVASRRYGIDPNTGEILPSEDTKNSLVVKSSVINQYVGYYDDNVSINPSCFLTNAKVLSPVYVDSQGACPPASDRYVLNFGGRFGAYYTGTTLGLPGGSITDDGVLELGDSGNRLYGREYNPNYQVNVGLNGGITSYIGTINSLNNTVVFSGPVIVSTYNSDASYTVNNTSLRTDKDPVQIKNMVMSSNSKLDLTWNRGFDLWYFGSLVGNTVEGGIRVLDDSCVILGSPGVRFFNEIVTPGTRIVSGGSGKAPRYDSTIPSTSTTPDNTASL